MRTSVSEECSRWKCYLHERQGVYISASSCYHWRCCGPSISSTSSLFLIFMHVSPSEIYTIFLPRIGPYRGFFHSSIRKRANASLNDPFLNSSAPLCRWAWSGPVMMNSLGVPHWCRMHSESFIHGDWYLSSTRWTCFPWHAETFTRFGEDSSMLLQFPACFQGFLWELPCLSWGEFHHYGLEKEVPLW